MRCEPLELSYPTTPACIMEDASHSYIRHLPTMQCRNEYDFVALAYLVPFLSFEFPVSIVDQDEDAWAARVWNSRTP